MTALALLLALAQQPDSGVILEAALDTQPAIVRGARLNYPLDLLLNGRQGRVVVQFILNTNGHAERETIKVISTPHMGFNLSAKAFVRDLVFSPPLFQGRKVRALMQMPIDFRVGRP